MGDDDNDNGDEGGQPVDGEDDGSSVLRGLQMDDEAQLLTWKVCERGGEGGGGVAKSDRGEGEALAGSILQSRAARWSTS